MKFLGTKEIALRAEAKQIETDIQKAEMSGAATRDPNWLKSRRVRLAELYGALDPKQAQKEQVKASQTGRFNPSMGDYDPLNLNLETAMQWIDRKYGNQPGYANTREQTKYTIQRLFNEKASRPMLTNIPQMGGRSVTIEDLDQMYRGVVMGKQGIDPGGSKKSTISRQIDRGTAQKNTELDFLNSSDPWEVAMGLAGLQLSGDPRRPIGGTESPIPATGMSGILGQIQGAIGKVVEQMRPSESIPSTQKLFGKTAGEQIDAYVKGIASTIDPANLVTPISGGADMINLGFEMMDPKTRESAKKALMGSTPEEQRTFYAKLLGQLTGGAIAGKVTGNILGKIKARPLPIELEMAVREVKALPMRTQGPPKKVGTGINAEAAMPQEIKALPAPVKASVVPEPIAPIVNPQPAKAPARPVPTEPVPTDPGIPASPTGSPLEWVSPDTVKVHPKMQFRGVARSSEQIIDPTGNTTGKYKNVKQFVPSQAGAVLVWEAKDGTRYVVDGHHRLDMAKRAESFVESAPDGTMVPQDRKILTEVKREVDGWTPEQIQFEGVMRNLRDQKADPLDAAFVLRGRGFKPGEITPFFKQNGVTVDGPTTRTIEGLLALDETTFTRALDSEQISQQALAGVGTQGLSPRQQLAALNALQDERITTFKQGQHLGEAIKSKGEPIAKVKDGEGQGGFGDMFGDEWTDYESTMATEVVLRSGAESIVARRFKSLLEPIGMETIDGEVINTSGRKQMASELGKSKRDVTSKLDALFKDASFQDYVTQTARDVLNENITEAQGATRIAEEAASRISGQTEGSLLRKSIYGSAEGGGSGAVPPGQSGGAGPSKQPRGPGKRTRESGRTDVKILGGIAGVAGGFAVYNKWDDIQKEIADRGLAGGAGLAFRTGLATAAGVAITGLALERGGRVLGKNYFDINSTFLDLRTLAENLPDARGKLLADTITATDFYKLRTAKSMATIAEKAQEVFGKRPDKSDLYREWNTKIRDHIETKVANGKAWSDGVPEPVQKFVETSIGEMDNILDKWEGMGGRIKVANDGTQQLKMETGASIRLDSVDTSLFGKFVSYDEASGKIRVEIPANAVNLVPEELLVKDSFGQNGALFYDIAKDEMFGRPVNRMGEAYIPRVYTREFVQQFLNPEGDFVKRLNETLTENGASPLTDAEFLNLQDMIRGMDSDVPSNVRSFLANLERERQLKLSKFEYTVNGKTVIMDPYENSYFDAVKKYIDRGHKRVAIAEVFGIESDALGNAIDGLRMSDPQAAVFADKAIGRLLDIGDYKRNYDNAVDKAARVEGLYQTSTKLFGGTSAVSQFSDVIIPLTEVGGNTVLKSIFKLARDENFRADIDAMNGVHQAWFKEMTDIDAPPGALTSGGKLVDKVMGVLLVKQMDRLVKRINTASIATEAERLIRKSSADPLTETQMRQATRLGVAEYIGKVAPENIDALLVSEGYQRKIAAASKNFQYTGDPADLPLWMSSPGGNVAMRFKKPWYVATKRILSSVVAEAYRGNLTPMARLIGWGITVGAGAQYMKDIIKFSGWDDETKAMFMSGDFEGGLKRLIYDVPMENNNLRKAASAIGEGGARNIAQAIGFIGNILYDSGSTGIGGEVFPLNQNAQDDRRRFNPLERMVPISAQSAFRYAGIIGDHYGDGFTTKTNANTYETIRSEIIPARRAFDLLSFKPDEVKRREATRKVKKLNKEALDPLQGVPEVGNIRKIKDNIRKVTGIKEKAVIKSLPKQ